MLVFTWNTSKLCFGDVNLSVCFKQNSARSIWWFLFLLFQKRVQHCHKMCSKACETRQDFLIESTSSDLMSGDEREWCIECCLDIEFKKSEKTFNQLSLLRNQAEENTSYNSWSIFRNLRGTIFQTKNEKVFHSSKVNIEYFWLD